MFKLPSSGEIAQSLKSLSRRQRYFFFACAALFLISVVGLLLTVNDHFAIPVAVAGGELTEGIIGTPRFINPLLATSDTDRDLTTLVYSGLMRISSTGKPLPDLAASYEVSADSLTYTFHLKPNLVWHDSEPLTASDVEYTILTAQDPLIKSPKRPSWDGVKVEKPDEQTIIFQLKQAYPFFLENATMGILPKHIWGKMDRDVFALNQFNTEGIGSGPYKIKTIKKDSLGLPAYYDLIPFNHFSLGEPKISALRLRFYSSEEALVKAYRSGEVESLNAIAAETAKTLETEGARIIRNPLPRVFGVFFNQSKAPVLADISVRQALDLAVDKQAIIDSVLRGYGAAVEGPLPGLTLASSSANWRTTTTTDETRNILTSHGWSWNADTKAWEKKDKKGVTALAFSLATADTPELKEAATLIQAAWQKLGARVDLKVFETGDLNQNVIRPRQYDALFFGEILGRQLDTFSFWHSSQRLDPGLNIALYANLNADKILEKLRLSTDDIEIADLRQKLQQTIAADVPAVLIYSPDFLYLLPTKVKAVSLPPVNTPADRFLNVYEWYIKTEKIWKIFVKTS